MRWTCVSDRSLVLVANRNVHRVVLECRGAVRLCCTHACATAALSAHLCVSPRLSFCGSRLSEPNHERRRSCAFECDPCTSKNYLGIVSKVMRPPLDATSDIDPCIFCFPEKATSVVSCSILGRGHISLLNCDLFSVSARWVPKSLTVG